MPETLTIEKLIHGGRGMGRLADGKIVFAEAVAPDDVINGEVVKDKHLLSIPSYELSKPSTHRQTPTCPHAQADVEITCGGCDWQHMPVAVQQHWKTEIIRESFQRIGKIAEPPIQPIQADQEWAYRHTAMWQVISHNGQPRLAYYARQSSTGVAFDACPVLPEALAHTAELLNTMPELLKHCNSIKARANSSGQVLLGIEFIGKAAPDVDMDALITGHIVGIWQLDEALSLLAGDGVLTEKFGDIPFQFGVHHFMQSHPGMVNGMLSWLNTTLANDFTESHAILDAYCGIGIFGLSLLQPHQQLTGVEGHKASIKLAKKNAKKQDVATRTAFHGQSMELFTVHSDAKFDLAICDPPRNGIKPAVLGWLSKSIRQTIVYISCDPATLARDSKLLTEAGWQLDVVQPFDMFPQTHHVETVAIFRRAPKTATNGSAE